MKIYISLQLLVDINREDFSGKGRKSDKGYCQLYRYKFNATKHEITVVLIISDDGKTS